jgi:enoyl-CoA hydratase/carnithine racemase
MGLTQPRPAIQLAVSGRIARITVGTGRHRNALSDADWTALATAADSLRQRQDVGVTVIAGYGADFCAGSDIDTWVGADADRVNGSFAAMEAAMQAVERLEMPTLAMIAGVAAGAGCQLALACDLRVMAASGRIGMPIAALGILVPAAFAARMTRLVGPQRSLELLYTGKLLSGPEAAQIGLVSENVADGELETRLSELAAQLLEMPATALRAAKSAVRAAGDPAAIAHASAVDMAVFGPAVTAFADRASARHEPARRPSGQE